MIKKSVDELSKLNTIQLLIYKRGWLSQRTKDNTWEEHFYEISNALSERSSNNGSPV